MQEFEPRASSVARASTLLSFMSSPRVVFKQQVLETAKEELYEDDWVLLVSLSTMKSTCGRQFYIP